MPLNRRSLLLGSAAAGMLLSFPRLVQSNPQLPLYGPPLGIAKLNSNENPYGPSPGALRAMMEASQKGAYYVNASAKRLKAMIAERHGLTPEHILLSSGSSGVLTYVALAELQHGRILGPDLFWDATARMALRQRGGEIKRLPKTKDLAIDLKAMEAAITEDVALVQVTNPNNPTGLVLPDSELAEFCKRASKKATILLDEAYNELTDAPEQSTMIPLIKAGYNVVVARTFSKIYGLAGMRVGYLIADPAKIEEVKKFGLGAFTLNQAGIAAAIASYSDEAFLTYSKSKIIEGREMIAAAVQENGLTALPSSTNFMFVNLGGRNADKFKTAMEQQGVLIRGIYRDYTHWSRVSMGLLPDVEKYVAALPIALEQTMSETA